MKTILLGMALCSLLQSAAHRAWIDTQAKDDRLIIQGKFANESAEEVALRYQLTTTKQGISGSSRSSQSGRFVAAPEEEVVLSQTSVNINSDDTYTVELKILREDTVYLYDQLVH